ncbi:MAG: response regulator transcription factor [Burkholderiales bacterium]|nr:response regulator transcription factor [Burkholderiales bacterium]
MKILVVDDHPLIREALRQVLKALDQNIELLEAANAKEAFEHAGACPDIQLILLDLTLPGSDGFTALRELREQHPSVPVVVLSGSDQPDTVIRALDEGAMGFIPKTSNSDVLVGALRLVLSGGVYLPPALLRQTTATTPSRDKAVRPTHYRDIGLTGRQAQVLALLVQGKPNKLICRDLNLAEGTVKIHVTAILKALGVANRTQAVIEVGRLGLKLDGMATGLSRQ